MGKIQTIEKQSKITIKETDPKLTNVFRRNAEAYLAGEKLIINQGGQGSSKTWSILQEYYLIAKYSKIPYLFTICSYALPHLKMGVIRDFYKILISFNENPEAIHNKTDHFFTVGKSTIEYFGIRDNYAKVHGPRRDFLFINEANNKVTYDDFDQLNQRTHICTSVDFNPRCRFWLHEKVMPYFKHIVIPSTYVDNRWLPEAELSKILWKKDKPQFENWWRVYGLGELGTFEGLVFPNWTYGEFPRDINYNFCLDFGFSPSPDAMVKVGIDQKAKKIYLDEQFYNYNQKPEDLRKAIAEKVLRGEQIIADSADKRMIAWLQGWFRINAVRKVGEVKEWLRLMQDYQIIVTETSHNLANELDNYVFLDEKDGVPIDDFNHLIDPARYGFMEKFSGQIYTRAI